jgi:hypothetical protein
MHSMSGTDWTEESGDRQIPLNPFSAVPKRASLGYYYPFHIGIAVRLMGALDRDVLERAINEIVRRHAVFRTTFHIEDGRPFQKIWPNGKLSVREVDVTGTSDGMTDALLSHEFAEPIDLAKGPPARVLLLRRATHDHVLFATVHHIICDAWSASVFVQELVTLYRAFLSGHPSPLSELEMQYADYKLWQRASLQGDRLDTLLSYWKAKLNGTGPSPVTQLPGSLVAVPQICTRTDFVESVPHSLVARLTEVASGAGATLFMVFVTALVAWIHRLTGSTDVGLLVPVANRDHTETEAMIGWFTNQLVLRVQFSGTSTLSQLLERVREVILEAFEHRELPYARLQEISQHTQVLDADKPKYTMFFQMMVPATKVNAKHAGDLLFTPFSYNLVIPSYQHGIEMSVSGHPDGLGLTISYPPEDFRPETISILINRVMCVLRGMSDDPLRHLSEVPFEPVS